MRFRFLVFFSALALAIGACANEVLTSDADTGSAAGTAGAGGIAGAGGTSSAGGTGGAQCPQALPAKGDACSLPDGMDCSYGPCCPEVFSCDGGVWHSVDVDCGPSMECPQAAPGVGTDCNACFQQAPCTYDLCDAGGGIVMLTCSPEGAWSVLQVDSCAKPFGCGPQMCAPGELCVRKEGDVVTYSCAPDPCAPDPISCACAEFACLQNAVDYFCTGTMGNEVDCYCPACAGD